jgi:tetratricopeptide (TPR) repeat protein
VAQSSKKVKRSLINFLLAGVPLKFIEFIRIKNIPLPMDAALQNVTKIAPLKKQRFILIGSLLLLFTLFSACNHHAKKYPQGRHNTKTQPPLVEQQLLSTIKSAEGLGKGNPLLLSSLYSLADFYQDRKEYDKAAEQYQRALHIKEEMSGPDHPDIAAILQRYARLLQEANRPTEAANLMARANAILAHSSPPLVSQ